MRFKVNPIIVKELRSRMRGARAFVILTALLLLLGTISYTLYRLVLATSSYSNSPLSPQIGQALFSGLALLELMMVCFITPSITAGAISGEREKQTYEMLLATPLHSISILWGKLISALSYVFLLIFAAVPMSSLVFIFGGVSPLDMIKALLVLIAVTVTLGVIGVFMSAWLGRTARATVLSYLVVLALLIGPVFIYILVGVLRQAEPPRWILVPNPLSALFSALSPATMPADGFGGFFWGLSMALGGNAGAFTGSVAQSGVLRPLYHYTLPLYGVITLVLYLLTIQLIRPIHRWRITWKEALIALGLILLFVALVSLAFASTADRYEGRSIQIAPKPGVVEREIVEVVRVEPTEVPFSDTPLVEHATITSPLPTLFPALQIPGPTITFTNTEIGFALDYPAEWYIEDTPGWQVVLSSYDPAVISSPEILSSNWIKIDLVRDSTLGFKTLDELVADIKAQSDQVLWEEEWQLSAGTAVRLQTVAEPGGEMAFLVVTINGHGFQMQGYGHGQWSLFDAIASTLRPVP